MIRVEGLRFTYPGNPAETLRGLSFEIAQGEVFGFLGPSGSGKSTTQKILIGLLRGFHGVVQVRERDLRQYGTEYYESIGVGFELPNHFTKLTGIENLRLFRSLYRGRTRDPMELMRLVDLADDADQQVAAYSKGMKMRLNFVRALLPDPEIVFLDEPTAGMDPVNARRIKDLIGELKRRGKTVSLLASRFPSVGSFLAAFGLVGVPLALPLIDYFEIWTHPLLWLNPAHPGLVLIRHAFHPGTALELGAALLLTVFWVVLGFRLALKAFHRQVSWRRGAA